MRFLAFLLFVFPFYCRAEDQLSPSVKQLLVAIAPDWSSMHGKLQRLEKIQNGWRTVGPPIPVLFGKSGLAWGRGLLVGQGGGPIKVEPERPTAGCTTMAEQNLVDIIRWLRSGANPEYVCLPKSEYLARAHAWGLPDPAVTQLF